jgi:sugar lactone lactonase YvrE
MSHSRNLLIGGLLTAALAFPFAPASVARPMAQHADLTVFPLPDNFRPEGIATIGSTAYVGSLADGDIYAIDLRTGEGAVVSEGPGTPSVGLHADGGVLWVAGGPTGTGRVVDPTSGDVLATYSLTTAPTFINDVVVTDDAAWFTDSAKAQLYRVSLADGTVSTLPLSGEWVQGATTSANGIETTPDGSGLLVVNTFDATLYRVDPATGVATALDLGAPMTNGDGLLRQGRTLYVVQNRLEQIAVVRLDGSGSGGTVTRVITAPPEQFQVPTTVARWGQNLYLPNAKFGAVPPATEFEVTRVSAR